MTPLPDDLLADLKANMSHPEYPVSCFIPAPGILEGLIARMEAAENDRGALIDCLESMVRQHCYDRDAEQFNSECLSANAYALRLLCKLGVMEMIHDGVGRQVTARFKAAGE